MKSYTIKYQWFKLIRTAEVSAKDYIAAKVEFERTKQISTQFIMKILLQ
jgi:hypothetical protein